MNKNTEALLVASLEVVLKVNAKKMGVYSCLITRMEGRSQNKNA
jgi:hypothetical protein